MQWQSVRDVFVAALEIDAGEREAFVARETTDHPDVEREVKRLLRLHADAGAFLETPDDDEDGDGQSLLSGGELIAERFEVLRLLGRGGMAEVYEALDRILGERVALKVMRSTFGDPAARTEQFRQEVQLARRVTHPGVCRVHDVAFHRKRDGQPLLVLTMELLAGETLAECLRRGPLPRERARSISLDIAAALDTAHTHGILHGDIKLENVILVARADGTIRAVLTDFGLARGLGVAGPSQPASGLIGTPAYMAPELFRGAAPSIASDVYAFALLTYRLLSAKDDLWRTTRVLAFGSGATATLPTGVRELERNRAAVFTKALNADPAARFESAGDFARALFPQATVRSRRLWIAGALAATAALVALAVTPFVSRLRLSPDEPGAGNAPSLLLMTATDNRTGESELEGMTELLRGQLAQSVRLEVLPPDSVAGVLKEMGHDAETPPDAQQLREVALRQGAALVLFSAVSLSSPGYRLEVRLEHVGARPSIVENAWDQTFQAPDRKGLLDATRRASNWVRTTAGESSAQLRDQDRLPAEITTTSWDALRLFAKAQDSQARGDSQTAIVSLQEAVRLDPEFVTAYARLGSILNALRREGEAYAAWQRAVALANHRQLTTRETLRLRTHYLEETGTLAEAEDASRAYAFHYPFDFDANIYLGVVIAQQGRTEESIPWLEQAVRLRPADPSGPVLLATRLIELERFDQAAAVSDRLRQSTQPDWATWMSALIAFARGDRQLAFDELERLRDTGDRLWRSRFHTLHSSWLAEAGRPEEAERELIDGVAFDAANGLRDRASLKWLHLAQLRGRAHDRAGSADAVKKALAVSNDARTLATAGSQFAQLGMIDELRMVRDALSEHRGISRGRLARQLVDANLQLALGQSDDASRSLEEFVKDRPFTESWAYYATTLAAAGRESEALAALADWVRHPARFYAYPEPPSPGPWAAAIDEYRTLLNRQGNNQAAADWGSRLLAFRLGQTATIGR